MVAGGGGLYSVTVGTCWTPIRIVVVKILVEIIEVQMMACLYQVLAAECVFAERASRGTMVCLGHDAAMDG